MQSSSATLIALLGLSAVAFGRTFPSPSNVIDGSSVETEFKIKSLFDEFTNKYGKQYSSEESVQRYANFRSNLDRINALNERNGSPAFGINQFADMSAEEFKATHLGYKPRNATKPRAPVSAPIVPDTPLASSKDWRADGAVSEVKDQGQCGSCWAFSATEQIESDFFLSNGTLPVLAPQQIVSCDTTDAGCNGGDTPTAYEYVQGAGGMEPEAVYPYTSGTSGANGKCKFSASKIEDGNIAGYEFVIPPCDGNSGPSDCTSQDITSLNAYVGSKGPASICVNAEEWQLYTDGVISASGCGALDYFSLDHCVQLVGYGTQSSSQYWLVRNSWGTSWGYDGYIYVAQDGNACGVADEVTHVLF